jgi:hypothetical protein
MIHSLLETARITASPHRLSMGIENQQINAWYFFDNARAMRL